MSLIHDGLPQLLDILPPVVREKLVLSPRLNDLVEVVLDYGRPAEARYKDGFERWSNVIVSEHDIEWVIKNIGEFGEDNRAGIERTLHRISAIRNRTGKFIGLTCRIGRALEGTIDIIDDIVRSGKSILILGKPGVGKTTKLREVARVLADEVNKRVVIVDTSNEIGGDGDVPHPAVGSARRMQVRNPSFQHSVMIEAVENHMPEVIVIDEIGNQNEAEAARTIAERGVQLIGTAHGQTLENLMLNPSLCDLVGGIQAVTLSDDEARRRGTQKTVLERKAPPTFDVVIELIDYDRLAVHHDVMKTVDTLLRGVQPRPEVRVRTGIGIVEVVQQEEQETIDEAAFKERFPALGKRGGEESRSQRQAQKREKPLEHVTNKKHEPSVLRVFPYGIARTRLERAIRENKVSAVITNDIHQADAVIAIRSVATNKPSRLREVTRTLPTVVVKSNTFTQIAGALDDLVRGAPEKDLEAGALKEATEAVATVLHTGRAIELSPQDARIRKLQHQVIEGKHLASESVGLDPDRRLRVLPVKLA